MDSFLARFKNSLVLITLVLLQTIALAVQVQRPQAADSAAQQTTSASATQYTGPKVQPEKKGVTVLRYWTASVLTPFERFLHGTGLRLRHLWSGYIDLRHTRQENEQLKQEVARLRQEQAAFAEDAVQGRRLQTMLDFRQHYIATTVAAQIIGTSGSDRSRMVIIDKGSADGLKPDQAVITPDGIVGKLRDVFPHTAQLLLINDPTAGAGVILASSRIRAIIHGAAGGRVQITNLTEDSRIKPGEHVLTSGGDQVFPRGLQVGVIESIAPDPTHQPYTAVTLKPAADLARLEEVLVVTGTQTDLPTAAQQDLAQADATAQATDAANTAAAIAQAQKRAAELAAERLPSVEPAPVDPKGPGGVPNSAPPRPPPALHPDRYSPGATPPATDLTPGGKH